MWDIYLGLKKVGRNDLAPVAVKEGKGGTECGRGNAPENSLGNDTPPSGLCLVDGYQRT